jgi:hypothetical protein
VGGGEAACPSYKVHWEAEKPMLATEEGPSQMDLLSSICLQGS